MISTSLAIHSHPAQYPVKLNGNTSSSTEVTIRFTTPTTISPNAFTRTPSANR